MVVLSNVYLTLMEPPNYVPPLPLLQSVINIMLSVSVGMCPLGSAHDAVENSRYLEPED